MAGAAELADALESPVQLGLYGKIIGGDPLILIVELNRFAVA